MDDKLAFIVLAAGEGTRMRSSIPKPLHKVAGKPMILHVLDSISEFPCYKTVVVIGAGAEEMKEVLHGRPLEFVLQERRLGTGHAVKIAKGLFSGYRGDIVVLYGDVPLVSSKTISELVSFHRENGVDASILTTFLEDPTGYGRVVKGDNGLVKEIVEEKMASEEVRKIKEINSGIYCFKADALFSSLEMVEMRKEVGELYLTDVIRKINELGGRVAAMPAPDPEELIGVDSRERLVEANKIAIRRKVKELMGNGVVVVDPDTFILDFDVRVGAETVVYPFTTIEGGSEIGKGCKVGPNVYIKDSRVGDGCEIRFSFVGRAVLGKGARVGPYGYLKGDRR